MTVPAFDRHFFRSQEVFSRIGGGSLGGKAEGLIRLRDALSARLGGRIDGIEVGIPRVVVLATNVFDAFMRRNDLAAVVAGERSDARIAHAFQRADLPSEVLGDLRALAESAHRPLAVRSSSLLEDALDQPFAGIYETKMIPNNSTDPNVRFRRLVEAVKLVWASTWFRDARTYRKAAGIEASDEKMAVLIQEIVGAHHGPRFYPALSAVCRSYSYYPIGRSQPEDGVVSLALGLGKTIVDGGLCWSYSPRRPKAPRPFGSVRQLIDETQALFWAVNMGRPPAYDPIAPAEYLVEGDLATAEADGTLRLLASTYDGGADRLRPGLHPDGPRVVDFAPLLQLRELPLNDLMVALLEVGEATLGTAVELEVAVTLPADGDAPTQQWRAVAEADRPQDGGAGGVDGAAESVARAGVVQIRPMRAPADEVEVPATPDPDALVATERAMGNGVESEIRDVVYVRPERFEAARTRAIREEVARYNRRLVDAGRPYLLIGFGRWGSSDPWLGIPVGWGEVSGARVIVEATLPSMDVEPSQGSHFFHNLANGGVLYFAVRHDARPGIDWAWLDDQPAESEGERVRHVRVDTALEVRVDGRTGRGVVSKAVDRGT